MSLGLPKSLPTLVRARYHAAKAAGELIFSSTELAVVRVAGVPFQLRYCPALSKKPEATPSLSQASRKPDPFLDPREGLLIAEVPAAAGGPTHNLVLNKYPVIPQHFILATKTFKEQNHVLEEDDLAIALDCLRAWEEDTEERLLAFFNSGEHSGASQPHRHIQFMPVRDMDEGGESDGWELLVDSLPHKQACFPLLHFHAPILRRAAPSALHALYLSLLTRAVSCVHRHSPPEVKGEAAISYNLAMTPSNMMLLPRRAESAFIEPVGSDTGPLGPVDVNGTILGGCLMVKAAEDWDALRSDESRLWGVLERIGYGWDVDGNVAGRL
ncbi:MAG: bifunctional AP-4-A phosphorylase/ADP sulfurylase [Thelocarpon impressellum]|nr:MAG: bifunctional AP-4-A phosphorylase/ADP sulfurylase [Thelocarpon impressellum]